MAHNRLSLLKTDAYEQFLIRPLVTLYSRHDVRFLMPNRPTHRRRRRDSTVELRRVGVGDVNTVIFATSSRRLPTDLVDDLEID